jgi:hypothetical protein
VLDAARRVSAPTSGAEPAGPSGAPPLVLLTSHLPAPNTPLDAALHAAGPGAVFDVIAMASAADRRRLAAYAAGHHDEPLPGFWAPAELAAVR